MARSTPALTAAIVGGLALAAAGVDRPADPARPDGSLEPPAVADGSLVGLLERHCLDCHDGPRGKGGLDLAPVVADAGAAPPGVLGAIRGRLVRRDMPPLDEPVRPSVGEYRRAVAGIDRLVPPAVREVASVRRLARAQYAGAVRDVLGVDPAIVERLLPADDIGEGFDTTADTLVLPPLLVEKYFDAAESIASLAAPPASLSRTTNLDPAGFERRGQGGSYGDATWLATNGALSTAIECAHGGLHRVLVRAVGSQAGDEPPRMVILVDGREIASHEVVETPAAPGDFEHRLEFTAGSHTLEIRFVNDFWDPDHPDQSRRDRNLGLVEVVVEGPLGETPETPFERALAEATGGREGLGALRDAAERFGTQLFRRPVTPEEGRDLALLARDAAGRGAIFEQEVRALVTALLVDPRFLLRVEPSRTPGERRPLDGLELASRLAAFLWSSVPDDELREAAANGALADDGRLRREVSRMLGDPRSRSLASRFAVQWLGIDRLESRAFDGEAYPELDEALLASMRLETELLFTDVVNGRRPVRELLDARETWVDARLAAHYGLESPTEDAPALRPLPEGRAPGILGHASILAATSNPNRTSPVKRGKWVLEALLDAAPPPPPPGVPQLPDSRADRAGRSIRELMALHRADPACASCHVRMDAIGLAFESFDADGRRRTAFEGVPIDDRTELPDGRLLDGVDGVRALVGEGEAFERALARHLAVYALGRGMADADDPLLDSLASALAARGLFEDLVVALVESEAFRTRVDPAIPRADAGPASDRGLE